MTRAPVHDVFRARAREHPHAAALVHRAGVTTYGELDRLSDGVARDLSASGVGPGNVVPVVLPVSPTLVATLLGVLKCGAAYAALDVAGSADDLRGVEALLLDQVAVADGSVAAFPRRVGDPCGPPPTTAEAAMVFTAPGEPRAVVSPHRATARLARDGAFGVVDRAAVVPLLSPPSSASFALELWGVLLNGGTSVLPGNGPPTAGALRDLTGLHGVTAVFLTAAQCRLVVAEDVRAFGGLTALVVGDGRLSAAHAAAVLGAHPDLRLVTRYGTAESTGCALTHDVRPADDPIPLGRPVARTSVHVLADGRECGPGEVGELVVAGDGLALGYLGDPGSTARAFVTAPLDGYPIRVHRTGELGRVDANGVFHAHERQVAARREPVFPSSPDGKTGPPQRPALPAGRAARQPYASAVEDVVAVEFAALLGVVDRHASFFAQGGTSLAAVRLCTRLGARFGRSIPVSRLVAAPTVTAFAAWLGPLRPDPAGGGRGWAGRAVQRCGGAPGHP
ncbi:AMP-binding protein [Actinosynnema sp. NPDC050436]|uniref:AMP-binding protein n=1 Tax=Actinosynnema sp. NPDC050436 TaxID=3155659 RepID=UPI0033F887C0